MATNLKAQVIKPPELAKAPSHSQSSMEEILNSIIPFECLDEILELVDLGKRRDSTRYSEEYKNAVCSYVMSFDFKKKNLKEFDQFIMQLVLTGSSLLDQPKLFYVNLNRLAVSMINAIYNEKSNSLKMQSVMYHMQMSAGEASVRINEIEESDFYLQKARQHFVIAVNFVQSMSIHKAFEAQCRVSDVDIHMLLNQNNAQHVEQAIVDTHNAVEYGKSVNHSGVSSMLERYSDLCDLLSDFRPEERAYWTEFSLELKTEADTYETCRVG
jgi:uncharacterized protein YeaC (DUF1315 family)